MKNIAAMSIDELQDLLGRITDPTSASPAEAVLQSKSILYLSSEVAIFKEALSNNTVMLNGTLGITNRNIRELRDSIKDSTESVITSNKELSKSQEKYSSRLLILTGGLVLVGVLQVVAVLIQTFHK